MIDAIGTALFTLSWLIIGPGILIAVAISSMVTKDPFAAQLSWLLILPGLTYIFWVKRKFHTKNVKTVMVVIGIALCIFPIPTNIVSWLHLAQCGERIAPNADLRYCNFSSHTFNDQDLSNANLTGANLDLATFRNTNLEGVNFTRASLGSTDFTGATLNQATFSDTDIREVVGVTPSAWHNLANWHGIKTGEPITETFQIMAAVCNGEGYPFAMPYAPAMITRETFADTIFAIGDTEDYQIQGYTGGINEMAGWQDSASIFTQLTACFHGEVVTLERCTYTTGTAVRNRRDISVEIRETLTGKIVATNHFVAAEPQECPAEKKSSTTSFDGYVNLSDIERWLLESFVK